MRLVAPLAALAALAVPLSAHATTFASASLTSVCGACTGTVSDSGAGSASVNKDEAGLSGDSLAIASYGFLRARIELEASDNPDDNSGQIGGNAQGEWTDTLTISHPTLNGTMGSVSFGFSASGILQPVAGDSETPPTPNASASVSTNLLAEVGFDSFDENGFVSAFDDATGSGMDPVGNASLSLTVDFVYGSSFTKTTRVIVSAFLIGSGSVLADLSSTIAWQGFQEVRDAEGNLVTDYTVTSQSGIDWSQPVSVPEPAAALLCLASLALGAASRRTFGASAH